MGHPFKSPPFKSPPFSVPIIVLHEFNIHLSKQHIKMYVLVKRNGKIIHYCTSYTPFGIERAIQT